MYAVLPCCSFILRMSVILKTLFTNISRDFLTNIDWLLQSHGSIRCFDWLIRLTFSSAFNICLKLANIVRSNQLLKHVIIILSDDASTDASADQFLISIEVTHILRNLQPLGFYEKNKMLYLVTGPCL